MSHPLDHQRSRIESNLAAIEGVIQIAEDAVTEHLDPLHGSDLFTDPGPEIKNDVLGELEADRQRQFIEMMSDRSWWTQDAIGQTLRKSLFVMTYAMLEDDLNQLCDHFAGSRGLTIRFQDLTGGGIRRAQAYLKKVVRVGFPDQRPEWVTLRKLSELRNAIVHVGGRPSPDSIKDFRALAGVEVSGGSVILDDGFHNEVFVVLRAFWRDLFLEIERTTHSG